MKKGRFILGLVAIVGFGAYTLVYVVRHAKMEQQCPEKLGGANVVAYAIVQPENTHLQRTKQIVAGQILGAAVAMVIAQYDGEPNYYVFGIYGDTWTPGSDTWHEELDDAIAQLDWEYKDLSQNLVWLRNDRKAEQSVGSAGRPAPQP